MSTNFYVADVVRCQECGHAVHNGIKFHIGKSSAGWAFSLHVIPEKHLNTWGEWKAFLDKPGMAIIDEDGAKWSLDEFVMIVENRIGKYGDLEHVPPGYDTWWDFYEINQCEIDANGLLRHKVGEFCSGHGKGSWDYVTGDFS